MQVVTIFVLLAISACVCHAQQYFLLGGAKTYSQAEAACRSNHAHLAIIRNDEELSAAKKVMGRTRVWIGMSDRKREGKWRWIGKSRVNRGWNWARGQPDNWRNSEDCGELNAYNSYLFNDENCNTKLQALCQAKAGKYKMFKGRFNFKEARLKCQGEGMQIAVIRNRAEQIQAARETRMTGRNRGCVNRGNGCRVFIGYKRVSRGGAFRWIGGSSTYRYFHRHEPNNWGGHEGCVELNFYGQKKAEWNDISCRTKLGVLCEPRRKFVMIKGRFDFNGAKKACRDAGMQLAVIKNIVDQRAVAKATRVKDHPGCVRRGRQGGCRAFIGYKRVRRGGAFKWIGGESSYRYFHRHEPNNWGGHESCVEVNFYGQAKAEWNDISCGARLSALCQPRPKFVMIQGRFDFNGAKRKCKQYGLKIAVIKNQLEQKAAAKATRVKNHPGCVRRGNRGGCRAFIGYKRVRRGGAFRWIDGSTSRFRYFHRNEPNNWGGHEGCVELNFYGQAKAEWNDISCGARLSVLCKRP